MISNESEPTARETNRTGIRAGSFLRLLIGPQPIAFCYTRNRLGLVITVF